MQILNEYIYQYVTTDIAWKPYSWVGIIIGLILLIGGLWLAIECDSFGVFVFAELLLVATFFIFFTTKTFEEVPRYEVVLTEDVSYREFTDKYKVIEERGDIIVVEERGINNE